MDRVGAEAPARFSEQFYFSRCFSEKFGLSPVKYRKKINPEQ